MSLGKRALQVAGKSFARNIGTANLRSPTKKLTQVFQEAGKNIAKSSFKDFAKEMGSELTGTQTLKGFVDIVSSGKPTNLGKGLSVIGTGLSLGSKFVNDKESSESLGKASDVASFVGAGLQGPVPLATHILTNAAKDVALNFIDENRETIDPMMNKALETTTEISKALIQNLSDPGLADVDLFSA